MSLDFFYKFPCWTFHFVQSIGYFICSIAKLSECSVELPNCSELIDVKEGTNFNAMLVYEQKHRFLTNV